MGYSRRRQKKNIAKSSGGVSGGSLPQGGWDKFLKNQEQESTDITSRIQPQGKVSTPGFTPFDPNANKTAKTPAGNFQIDKSKTNPYHIALHQAEVKRQAQQEQYNKLHPGSWKNTLPILTHALGKTGAQIVSDVANIDRDLIGKLDPKTEAAKPLYNEDGSLTEYGQKVDQGREHDILGNLVIGFNAYNDITTKHDQENPLPHTLLGNTASGAINLVPDLVLASLLPEDEAINGASRLNKVKNAIWNPLTKVGAMQEGLNSYTEAKQKGKEPGDALKEGLTGAGKGFINYGTMGLLGGLAGDVISPKFYKSLTESGVVKRGALTKAGLDVASDVGVFSLYPMASNLVQGKPFNLDEVESNAGVGALFGALKGFKTIQGFEDVDDSQKEDMAKMALSDRQSIAIQNFMNATPESIAEAHTLGHSVGDLNAMAIQEAAKIKDEPDEEKKNQHAAAASTLAKASDIKGVTQAILQDKGSFVESIQNSELPDDQKSAVIDKINQIHANLDPVEKLKNTFRDKMTELDGAITQGNDRVTAANADDDPVEKIEAGVIADKLQKERDLLDTQFSKEIAEEYERQAKVAAQPLPETLINNEQKPDDQVGEKPLLEKPHADETGKQEANGDVPADKDKNHKFVEAIGDEVQDSALKGKEYKSEMMSPDDYIKESGGYESTYIDQKKVDAIKEKIKSGIPLDPPTLTNRDGTNIGQEGRHRAEAAKQLGIEEIPVVRIDGELPDVEKPKQEVKPEFSSEDEATRHAIEKETNPRKIAAKYHLEVNEPDYVEKGIIDYLGNGKINLKDYERWGDKNNIDRYKKQRWLDEDNSDKTGLDQHAEILSHELGVQVTPQDFIETIDRYRGRKNFDEANKTDNQRLMESRYRELTGNNLTPNRAERAYERQRELKPDLSPEELAEYNKGLSDLGITHDDIKNYEEYDKQNSGYRPTSEDPEQYVSGASNDKGRRQEKSDGDTGAQEKEQPASVKPEPLIKSPTEKITNAEKAKTIAEKIRALKTNNKNKMYGGLHGVATAIYDGALETAASAIEAGGSLADAISAAIAHIKGNSGIDDEERIKGAITRDLFAAGLMESGTTTVPKSEEQNINPAKAPTSWFSSVFGRNFSDLAEFEKARGTNQEALSSVYKAAGAVEKSNALLKITGIKILKEFKSPTEGAKVYDDLRKVLLQSNLNGLKQRWYDASTAAENISEEDLKKWVSGDLKGAGSLPAILDALSEHEAFAGIDKEFASAMTNGDFYGARSVLQNGFKKAGNSVQDLDWSDRSYDETRNDPKVQKAKGVFVNEFSKPLEEAHVDMGGNMRSYLGEENTYFPTNTLNEKQQVTQKWYQPKRSPIQKFITPHNDFATGLAEQYDHSVKSLEERIIGAVKANSFNKMIDVLHQQGYITPWTKGSSEGLMNIDGTYYEAERVNINKSNADKRPDYYLIPKGISNELDLLMQSPPKEPSKISELTKKVFGFVNGMQLSTPLEATAHSANLLSRLASNTPFAFTHDNKILDYAVGKGLGSLPIIKNILQTTHMLGMDPESDKWLSIAKEMADVGETPKKYGGSTYSKAYAESTGADLKKWYKLQFSPLLYGTKGLDIRARMMMWSVMKDMNPDATPLQVKKMMGTLGDYNKNTQSEIVRGLKGGDGAVPFIVSGHSRLYNGFKSFTGGNLPLEGLPTGRALTYRIQNLVNASVYGYLGTWAAMHLLATGKPFWEDKDAVMGEVPISPAMRQWMTNHHLGDIINRHGNDYNFSIGGSFSGAQLGTKMAGLDAFYNYKQADANNEQGVEQAFLQSFNTLSSPVTSAPIIHNVSNMFGVAPYILSARNSYGEPSPQLLTTALPAHSGEQVGSNLINTALNVNPLVGATYNLATKYTDLPKFSKDKSSNLMQVIYDQFLPKSMVRYQPVDMRAKYIKRDEKAAEKGHLHQEIKDAQEKDRSKPYSSFNK